MTETVTSWIKEHYVIGTILVAILGWLFTLQRDKVELESHVKTLEIRGSPHLEAINQRLTATEKDTEANKAEIRANKERTDRIIEVMTRELGKTVK